MKILSWNDGFETRDTRRTEGKLQWVRQNIMLGDVSWARLWMRKDAAEVWAGWTALVWFAAQHKERGTITDAEEVSILSRVPMEYVEKAITWGMSCGMIEGAENVAIPANLTERADCAQVARTERADSAPTVRYETERNETEQDETPPKPPRGGKRAREPFVPPTESEWVEYCAATWTEWHPTCAAETWAYYESVQWRMKAGPVRDWKAAARTSHGNARTWGKLQPQATTGGGYNKPAPINHRERADAEYWRVNGPLIEERNRKAAEERAKRSPEQVAKDSNDFDEIFRQAQLQWDRMAMQSAPKAG